MGVFVFLLFHCRCLVTQHFRLWYRCSANSGLAHCVFTSSLSFVCVRERESELVCVGVSVREHQRLKDAASSNPLYSKGYVELRTELGAHSVIDREEKDSQGFIHKPTDHDD